MADVPMVGEIAIRVHEGEISAATVSLNSDSTENTEVNRQAQETDCLLPIHDNQTEEQENQLNRAHYRNGNPGEDNDVIPEKVYAQNLRQIEENSELRLILREWEKMFELARERIEKKSTRAFNAKSELYQLIGFYSVFQGVVLTAVAQSNTLYCLSSWGPASLSLLASAVTVVSVHYKLTNYSRLKVALKDERTNAVDLLDQILELKNKGDEFDFSWLKGEYERRKSRKKSRKVEGLKPRYYWLVVLPLVLFSLIILACCFFVLCGPGSHNHP